jgi:pilus assembly protein CpaB
VARADIPAGERVAARTLALRRVPARFAPPGALGAAEELAGLRLAVDVPAGSFLLASHLAVEGPEAARAGAPVRRGERVAEVVAVASAELVQPGARVDVLVTTEPRGGAPGRSEVALEDVEVLGAREAGEDAGGGGGEGSTAGAGRVAASLRVSLRQAVYLAAAQSYARELRLLPRAAGDRERSTRGVAIGAQLG